MTATLDGVAEWIKNEPTAEEKLAAELVAPDAGERSGQADARRGDLGPRLSIGRPK